MYLKCDHRHRQQIELNLEMTKAKNLMEGSEHGIKPYNDYYTNEALHTTFVLMETFAQHVIETRCAEEFKDVYNKAEEVHQALFDLYQLIGTKFVDAADVVERMKD